MSADRSKLRLSDAEREEALDALSQHVQTGRLDLREFDTRSAKVTAATTRRDLAPLFDDLPAPLPSALHTAGPPNDPARLPRSASPAPAPASTPARRASAGIVPIAAIVAVILFFTVAKNPAVFLLVAVVAVVAGWISSRGGRGR